jgi:hypothetical protein
VSIAGALFEQLLKKAEMALDNRIWGSTIDVSPPIRFRIEWADSQGKVTASWLAAHFNFGCLRLLCSDALVDVAD